MQVRDLVVAGPAHGSDRLDLEAGEHLLVTGPNGSGKSTLLGVLAGRLRPRRARVSVGGRVAGSPRTYLRRPGRQAAASTPTRSPAEDAPPLRELGLVPRATCTGPSGCCVGQRRRLALAIAVAAAPDLLLLDEPTNHLSPALADELEEALGRSPGAVVVASHDRWLRRRWEGSVHALG